MINKKKLKEYFKKRELKIGKETLNKFIENIKKDVSKKLDFVERKTKISGRKIIKEEDFKEEI